VSAPGSTLVGILRRRARDAPGRLAVAFDALDGSPPTELTYADLDRRARRVAVRLRDGAAAGSRVLLVYPPGIDFVVAFFGCLYAGTVAVPTHPPRGRAFERFAGLVADAQVTLALTTSQVEAAIQRSPNAVALAGRLAWIPTDVLAAAPPGAAAEEDWTEPDPSPDAPAFLQYTSGSTGSPKGVTVSHGNIMHNSAVIARAFGHTPDSSGAVWLPPQHDMGLIGGVLQPVYVGMPVTLMSPLDFLQQPLRWLETISRTRATTSGGPNFAYDLCVRRATPARLAGMDLDLSCWDVAFTGAEPIRAETLDRFTATFAPYGFRAAAWYPCYGLAESTLLVTGAEKGAGPTTRTVHGNQLDAGLVSPAEPDARDARTLVSCGRPGTGLEVAVVDPQTSRRSLPGEVGEVWVHGPSVAQGYWNQPAESARVFRARLDGDPTAGRDWLRTGDLGYLDDGELLVVGRLKDLVIIDGRNHYPEDIEQVVEASHDLVRSHGCAAFSVDGPSGERLVVVAEVERTADLDPVSIGRSVRHAVADVHGVGVATIVLVRPGAVPRTTSGKIRRHACRAAFQAGTLVAVGRA
jgi:acyl-CoA synthetase (AMP-forming)/AMP-acid ligase II